MAASRKLSVVAALVLMTLLSTGVASAQTPPADLGVITCNSVAVPPIVRAEGIAGLVGGYYSHVHQRSARKWRISGEPFGHQRECFVERERNQ